MSKRYFEFSEGTSNKFWEVWMEGTQVLTRYGKIGANGQTTTKNEGTPEKAQKLYDKLVKEKTGKGYVEKAATVVEAAPTLDPAALEAQLAQVRKTPTADVCLVFADWLQAAGHPWGRLIAVQHGLATAASAQKPALEKEEKTILREYGEVLTGNLQRTKNTAFDWTTGFIKKATLGAPGDGQLLAKNLDVLLKLPTATLLSALVLDPRPETLQTFQDWDASPDNIVEPWAPVLEALPRVPKQVTHVAFGAEKPEPESAYVAMPPFSGVSKALPHLESLVLTGSADEPDPLDLPELKRLDVRFAAATGAQLSALARSKLPKLEHLSFSVGGIANCVLDDAIAPRDWDEDDEDAPRYPETYPVSTLEELEVYDIDAELRPTDYDAVLQAKWPASLKSFGITSAPVDQALIDRLAASPLLPQLTALDLSGGTMKDQTARVLISQKGRFAHLASLDLTGNLLTADVAKEVAAALPNAKVGAQRGDGNPDFFMRYVATME